MKNCGSTGSWTQGLSLTCEHHWATEPPGHLTNNFSPGYTLPRALKFKFVHKFPVGKSTNFLYPSTKDIQTKPPLHSGFLMLGAICNRWKIEARPGLEPRGFRWRCKRSTTELPNHPVISPTILHLKPTPVTYVWLYKHWQIRCILCIIDLWYLPDQKMAVACGRTSAH